MVKMNAAAGPKPDSARPKRVLVTTSCSYVCTRPWSVTTYTRQGLQVGKWDILSYRSECTHNDADPDRGTQVLEDDVAGNLKCRIGEEEDLAVKSEAANTGRTE